MDRPGKVHDIRELRERVRVFRDRAHAGEVLAGMLDSHRGSSALILAVPAGGVPVAVAAAGILGLGLDVEVASKITLPWNTETGYGAVAAGGTVVLNRELVARVGLSGREIEEGIRKTRAKVERRAALLRGTRPFPDLCGREVILIDDGLASGFTLLTAVKDLGERGAARLIVAVPTGHRSSAERVAAAADAVYCANLRGGPAFAVAEAYERWTDVSEADAARLLEAFRRNLRKARTDTGSSPPTSA